jgi:hypothetical protein
VASEAAQKLMDAGALLGFHDPPLSGLLSTVQEELRQAQAAVEAQAKRAPTIRNEERRLEVTERVHPGTIAEHRRQKRRDQAAFEPILVRF